MNDQNPGLRDYEASLLRLLDKLTNGMAVEINESGTALKYKPGIVTGGRAWAPDAHFNTSPPLSHQLNSSRPCVQLAQRQPWYPPLSWCCSS